MVTDVTTGLFAAITFGFVGDLGGAGGDSLFATDAVALPAGGAGRVGAIMTGLGLEALIAEALSCLSSATEASLTAAALGSTLNPEGHFAQALAHLTGTADVLLQKSAVAPTSRLNAHPLKTFAGADVTDIDSRPFFRLVCDSTPHHGGT